MPHNETGGSLYSTKLNKFEPVSSDDHQMSVAEGVPRSDVVGYPTMWPWTHDTCDVPTPTPGVQTDAGESITFPQLRLRAVKTVVKMKTKIVE